MTEADLQTVPAADSREFDDGDVAHNVCCNDMALCGVDCIGGEESEGGVPCPICCEVDARQEPCGARLCRIRMRIRGWWAPFQHSLPEPFLRCRDELLPMP